MNKPRALILCTGNSARSQMAEGIMRKIVGERYEVISAGLEPKGVNPLAIEAMKEVGIDISHHTSKDVRDFLGQHFTYLITVCSSARYGNDPDGIRAFDPSGGDFALLKAKLDALPRPKPHTPRDFMAL